MSGGRSRRTSAALRWGVAIAAAVALLACAPAALAAPTTTNAAAYQYMKSFMTRYHGDLFAKKLDRSGSWLGRYRGALAGVAIAIDPKLGQLVQYGVVAKTLSFREDPRTVTGVDAAAMGAAVWHGVTHALEDQKGDFRLIDSCGDPYRERNVDYMAYVIQHALPPLDQMERAAKAHQPVGDLRPLWVRFQESMHAAQALSASRGYPYDYGLLNSWFRFFFNPDEIQQMYINEGGLLRAAVSPLWTGTWAVYGSTYPRLTLTEAGSTVTGVWGVPPNPGEVWQPVAGTVSADGLTLTADWTAVIVGGDGVTQWNHVAHIEVLMTPATVKDPDTWVGDYHWTDTSVGGTSAPSSGDAQIYGTRVTK